MLAVQDGKQHNHNCVDDTQNSMLSWICGGQWLLCLLLGFPCCSCCRTGVRRDLLATSGDHLRIWNIQEDGVVLDRLLTNVSTALASQGTCSVQTAASHLLPVL